MRNKGREADSDQLQYILDHIKIQFCLAVRQMGCIFHQEAHSDLPLYLLKIWVQNSDFPLTCAQSILSCVWNHLFRLSVSPATLRAQ